MTQDLAEKIYNLQKNVLELHNLFDLNMVANQSRSIEDLLSKVSFLIKSSLNLSNIRFFVNNNDIFQTKNIATGSDLEFEFNADNAPFLQNVNENIIKVTNQDGSYIYKSFWAAYNLEALGSEYIKVFYNEDNEKSVLLAKSIQESFNSMEQCVKKSSALKGDYYILNCTQYPSVIAECGFLSNPDDERLLISDDYQNDLAYSIYKGIVGYLTQTTMLYNK